MVVQMIAYLLARAGETKEACEGLDDLLRKLVGDRRDWVRATYEKASTLKQLLISDPIKAQQKLAGWEAYSVSAMGLEKLRSNPTLEDTLRPGR